MWLTARNVPQYLIEQRLLSPEALLSDDVTVEELPHRNRNFRVRLGSGGGVFLKQAALADPLARETLRTEAQAYRLLHEESAGRVLHGQLPALLLYDSSRHILALELLSGRESLGDFHRREMRFPPALGSATWARRWRRLHRGLRRVVRGDAVRESFPNRIPWVLNASRPESIPLSTQFGGSRELVAIVQRYPEIRDQLETLRQSWTPDTLIHGDIKWDNCLVAGLTGEPAGGAPVAGEPAEAFHLVDWEMADVGDAAWDVGGVFQSYLSYWALSPPGRGRLDAGSDGAGGAVSPGVDAACDAGVLAGVSGRGLPQRRDGGIPPSQRELRRGARHPDRVRVVVQQPAADAAGGAAAPSQLEHAGAAGGGDP